MRAGNGPKREDERDQRAAGGNRVRQQCKANVAAAQALRHDARTDDGQQEERRTDELRYDGANVHVVSSCTK